MADETPTAALVATPSPSVEATPVAAVATPVVSPVITPTPEAAVVTSVEGAASGTPVVEPTAKTETQLESVKEPAKPLLGPDAVKPEEVKADAPKVEGEAPKAEVAPLPVYEFKLPEGANSENPVFKSFQTKLAELQNLSKTEQSAMQKFGQEMIDMHMADVKTVVENQNKLAWDWFNNRNKEWLESAKKDPQIGGENFDKTINSASQAISLYGGTKSQQIETAKLLQETGVENSPVMLRFLSNITKIAAKEGQPVTGSNAPMQGKFNPAQALFGGEKKTA